MSIKIDDDDEQNQRSRLKELITQRLESQSIALATEQENEQDLRSRLKKGIIQRTEPLLITQIPFIEETETDKETVETTEKQTKRRELIHAYLKSTMEKEENEQKEQNKKRELLHAYSKLTMDNKNEQTEQDKTKMYLRTSMEEEYDEDEPFEEQDDEGEWTTQSSHLTNKEENTLFIAFINGDVEDQKNIWINAKMNLAKNLAIDKNDRQKERILEGIIPTELVNLDEVFDEEEMDNLSERQPYSHAMD
jgi:hypothetical protein